jgi:hypothetical protein
LTPSQIVENLITYEEKDYIILFILEIGSLEKMIDYIVKGGDIILEAGVILLRSGNEDQKELFCPTRSPTLNQLFFPGFL